MIGSHLRPCRMCPNTRMMVGPQSAREQWGENTKGDIPTPNPANAAYPVEALLFLPHRAPVLFIRAFASFATRACGPWRSSCRKMFHGGARAEARAEDWASWVRSTIGRTIRNGGEGGPVPRRMSPTGAQTPPGPVVVCASPPHRIVGGYFSSLCRSHYPATHEPVNRMIWRRTAGRWARTHRVARTHAPNGGARFALMMCHPSQRLPPSHVPERPDMRPRALQFCFSTTFIPRSASFPLSLHSHGSLIGSELLILSCACTSQGYSSELVDRGTLRAMIRRDVQAGFSFT